MSQHTALVLFGWVWANQAGVPLPVAPWLLTTGALASSGRVSLTMVFATAVAAALAADLVWYGLGRWRGAETLAACFRLLRLSPTSRDRVERAFRTHERRFAWSARFVPELNPVAAGLAGATRVTLARFLPHAAGSAVTWAGAWAGAGYLLGEVAAARPGSLSIPSTVMVAVALAAATVGVLVGLVARRRRGRLAGMRAPGRGSVANPEPRRARPTSNMGGVGSGRIDRWTTASDSRVGEPARAA